ncbi:MAG: type II toxin-antitoxin system RelE/ParE family toxin [Spirochaetes bacterium]|nr:type II toxin-antitoxin system RelE/ParE family toxin [Spirochaetota bacterium]
MVAVRWTDRAELHLHDIHTFIAQDSPHFARLTVANIVAKSQILSTQPKIGRKVPELNREDIREIIHKNYRIVYRLVHETQIDILTVVYGTIPLDRFEPLI